MAESKRPKIKTPSRIQRRLKVAELRAKPKPAPDPLLLEPSWFQRIYTSVMSFLGLRKSA